MHLVVVALSFLTAVGPGDMGTLSDVLERERRDQRPVLYTECKSEQEQVILLVPLGANMKLVELRDGYIVEYTEIRISQGQIHLVDPLGGMYSHRRTMSLANALLSQSFTFLMPDRLEWMVSHSKATVPKCPAPPAP